MGLADQMTGRSCNEDCASNSLVCIGAWEEVADDCNVKEVMTCGQAYHPSTSDLICECSAITAEPIEGPGDPETQPTNTYALSPHVGEWGGWCTCPDGQRYNVGDRMDACASGPASLACYGGTPGECRHEVDADRAGMKVICAAR